MLNKFLKEVMGVIAGKPAEDLIDLLDDKKYINEFIIAKKLDITINQTRNILYKVSDYGLVSFIRKKDKKKGWYTYFWKIETLKFLEFLEEMLTKRIEQINNQIKSRETKQFYICDRCNLEFNEENALLKDFTCDECGQVFSIRDNSKILKELQKNHDKIESELKIVNEEIKKEKEIGERKKTRERKKEEKIAKEVKAKKRIERIKKVKKEKKATEKKEKLKKKPKKIPKKVHKKTKKKKIRKK